MLTLVERIPRPWVLIESDNCWIPIDAIILFSLVIYKNFCVNKLYL